MSSEGHWPDLLQGCRKVGKLFELTHTFYFILPHIILISEAKVSRVLERPADLQSRPKPRPARTRSNGVPKKGKMRAGERSQFLRFAKPFC